MFVATDKDGSECIYGHKPKRYDMVWHGSDCINVPKGTIQRLLNYPLTWDDDCQEIVEYKDKDLKEDKVIKQNIKMRVTPEQSRKIQEICFANGIYWPVGRNDVQNEEQNYLFIDNERLTFTNLPKFFASEDEEEIDADLFIRTNGTCEDVIVNDYDIDFADKEYTKLEKKVFNLKKQLEKYVVKIANQKEELTRLLSQKEDLQNRLNTANRAGGMSIDNDIELIRLVEEKDTIIKYLENKLKI